MIFLIAVLIGIVTGYLLGGRLSRLSSLRLRGVWLVLLAVLIQALIFPLFTDRPVIPVATEAFHLISYLLVFIWLALNISVRPLLLVGAGALCNLLVIVVNGGKMPASITAMHSSMDSKSCCIFPYLSSWPLVMRRSRAKRSGRWGL